MVIMQKIILIVLVRIIILILIFVFDPLAVLLLIAANISLRSMAIKEMRIKDYYGKRFKKNRSIAKIVIRNLKYTKT